MALFLVARHAQSLLNHERRINGDPSVEVPLTAEGEEEARRLGQQVVNVAIGVCVHTRFGRTRATAELALAGRDIPFVEEPLLDDIYVGELEGRSVDDYRAWKARHRRSDAFPGGESLDAAAGRYAEAFLRLTERPEEIVLVVCHEIALRYALNGAHGSAELDAPFHALPNATPYLFDPAALARAAGRVRELATPG